MATRTERQSDKSLNELHARILKELMQRPDNRRCADCRKRDPRWASWNLGIFVCIRCSGFHRSMGTHISKVKSADLDTWTPEQIENMQRWGNGKANMYWEHDWPRDMEPPENNIEQFIRAKYERKQYAMRGPVPDPATLGGPSATSAASATTAAKSASPAQANLVSIAQPAAAPQQTASQQLFDAFQAPSSQAAQQQSQSALKNSILSLYGNAPAQQSSPVRPAATIPQPAPQQQQLSAFSDLSGLFQPTTVAPAQPTPAPAAFANFAAFSAPPVAPPTQPFASPAFATLVQPAVQQAPAPQSPFGNFATAPVSPPSASIQPSFGAFGSPQASQISPPSTVTPSLVPTGNSPMFGSAAAPATLPAFSAFSTTSSSTLGGSISPGTNNTAASLPARSSPSPGPSANAPSTLAFSGFGTAASIPTPAAFPAPSPSPPAPNTTGLGGLDTLAFTQAQLNIPPPPRDTTADEWSSFQ